MTIDTHDEPRGPGQIHADFFLMEIVAIGDDRITSVDDHVIWVDSYGLSAPGGWVEESAHASLNDAHISDGYYLDYRRNVTEWGASGAAESLLITLGEGVFVESAILVAGHFARRLAARLREADTRPMAEEEAVAWARMRVSIKYGLEDSDLRVARVSQDADGNTSVELVGAAGVRYELALRGTGAGVRVAQCTRVFPFSE